MVIVNRLKLHNFRRFPSLDIKFDDSINIFVGDNEAGKSSILMALDLVLSGSRSRIEAIGLQGLFNNSCIQSFKESRKRFEDLPILYIEVYLTEQDNSDLNGKNNSEDIACDGLCLYCEPMEKYGEEITEFLSTEDPIFPFEYYEPRFYTFAAKPYSTYSRPIRHLKIDSSQINNEYATREYIKDLYTSNAEGIEKIQHRSEYRKHKNDFTKSVLSELNSRLDKYEFTLKTTGQSILERDLTIAEEGITIDNKGKGQQCFIKTEFALKKPARSQDIAILLLEEPENHLSHVNMKKLISLIRQSTEKQLFVATHSDFVSARLDLRKCVLLNSNSTDYSLLNSLPADTASFFMKAPNNNILEFILAKNVILVEGNAEYILIDAFFRKESGKSPEDCDVHIISVGGTSFKRYLDLALMLTIKTAVVRDNDGNPKTNCKDRYEDYTSDSIQIFYDNDKNRSTFEICLYQDNIETCDELFAQDRKKLTVQDYMLKNKAEAAFSLLQHKVEELSTPSYIVDAIKWISE